MTYMIQITLIAIITSFVSGCKPEPAPIAPNSPASSIIWKWERAYKSLASNNFIYKNLLIQGTNSADNKFNVVALTLDSGKLVWETGNLSVDTYFNPFDVEDTYLFENKLVLSKGLKTYVIDVETGQIIWNDNLEKGYSNVAVIDNFVYKTTQTQQKNELYRYNIHTGQRELLFTLTKAEHGDGMYEIDACMPVKWIDAGGNEHLVLASRGWSGNSYRMDIMSWNLTADSMSWYRKGLAERASSSRPAIEDNRVYFFSISEVFCIDAAKGNTLWSFERDPGDDFSGFKTANILLVKDKVIAKSDSYWMYGIDKMTGQRLWANSNTATMPGMLREHLDTIWFSSGGVHAINANTGRTLIDGWDNNGKGPFWSNSVVHHPTLGYIYTTDGDYIYCLDPSKMK